MRCALEQNSCARSQAIESSSGMDLSWSQWAHQFMTGMRQSCGSKVAKSIFSIVSSAIMEMDSIGPSAVTTENPVAVW